MILYIFGLFIIGLLAGGIARFIVSSPQRLGCIGTALLRIVGCSPDGGAGFESLEGRPLCLSGPPTELE